MAAYGLAINSTTLSTSSDSLTILPAANRCIQVIEVTVCGLGTASAANVLGVYRSTAGTTGSAAVTVCPVGRVTSSEVPVAGFANWTAWSTQPTLGAQYLALGVNANGGIFRWVARPGEELLVASSDEVSFRAASGSSSVSLHVIVMEDAF